MTLSIITRDITDSFGNLLEGAMITVREGHGAGGALADLYSDSTGDTPISNPVTVVDGTLSVYVVPGQYRLEGTSSAGSGNHLVDTASFLGEFYTIRAEEAQAGAEEAQAGAEAARDATELAALSQGHFASVADAEQAHIDGDLPEGSTFTVSDGLNAQFYRIVSGEGAILDDMRVPLRGAFDAETELRIAGDERWPAFPVSYPQVVNFRHVQMTPDGVVIGYTDNDGLHFRWDATIGEYTSETSLRIAGDERWPLLTLGIPGLRHVQMTPTGTEGQFYVVGYTDNDGLQWTWSNDAEAYVPAVDIAGGIAPVVDEQIGSKLGQVENLSLYNEPLSWPQKEALGVLREQVRRDLGYSPVEPDPAPIEGGGSPVPHWVQDVEEYGLYVTTQIPKVTMTLDGRYLYRAEYGRYRDTDGEILSEGAHGELVPCWVRISRWDMSVTDVLDTDPEYVASVVGSVPDTFDIGVIDPMLETMHSGDLLITVPTVGGGERNAFAAILSDPSADTIAPSQLGPWSWIGKGFVGRPRWHGSEVRMTVNDPTLSGQSEYIRIRQIGQVVERDVISVVPHPDTDINFQEPSIIPCGQSDVLYTMRTLIGPYESRSLDGGLTWPVPTPMVDAIEWSGRNTLAEMARSPSGLLIFAHNRSTVSRTNMALAISNDDGRSWPIHHILDPEISSYPSLTFGRFADGSYDGWIYLAYDNGRGRIESPPGVWLNNLVVTRVNEASLLTDTPIFTIHRLDDTI